LQVYGSNTLPDPDVFVPWLGPVSLATWRHIETIWRGKHSLADVIRAEQQERDRQA
jgi:hypothetical protein